MVAFPYYDASDIQALNAQGAALLTGFAGHGYVRQEPSILQPADIFLDRSGEEIRRRTFTLSDPSGRELCLRPDLTIPICHQAVATNAALPARISYNGPVFRYQPARPDRPVQFYQAGVELLGQEDAAAGEAEILALAFDGLRAAGLAEFDLLFGDLSLFGALVDALDVPAHWGARLKRNFWRAGYVETLLKRLGDNLGPAATREALAADLQKHNDAPRAGRDADDVMDRALAKAAEAATMRMDPVVAGVITRLFGISAPAEAALAQIADLLKAANINLDAQMDAMAARIQTIAQLGVAPARQRFTAHFGRNMEYYTGFVFELSARDAQGPVQIAGGGRYDTLMQSLGAPGPVSAIGCAIRTERLLAARRFAGAA
jgi:ATP phosphoribosyltransferase regulatory subunit